MISPNRECSSFPIKIKIDKADVGLENVDNTADLDKPISNAVRDYLDGAKDSVSTNVALAKEYADNAKASETNCETIEAKIEALNVATVDTAQNITGAKTFAGETTITGPLGVSGDTALSGKVTVEKELNVDSNGIATLNGKVTASNAGNSLKVANHDTALISNDVLSAKDINTPNGDANNLLHRSGDEEVRGIKSFLSTVHTSYVSIDDPNYDDITKGPPSKGIGIKNISFKDSKGNTIAYLGPYVQTDGTVYIQLGVWSFTQNKIVVTNLVSQK